MARTVFVPKTGWQRMVYYARGAALEGVDGETMMLDADGFASVLESPTLTDAFATRSAGIVTVRLTDFLALKRLHGRDAGGAVVAATASRLHRCSRGGDILGRTAPDTFRMIIMDPSPTNALRVVGARVREFMGEPTRYRQQALSVPFDIVTSVPTDTDAVMAWLQDDRNRTVSGRQATIAPRPAQPADAVAQLTMRPPLAAEPSARAK
ncbi:MAG: diguanylate cyclase [Pseudomonadota bacterium]